MTSLLVGGPMTWPEISAVSLIGLAMLIGLSLVISKFFLGKALNVVSEFPALTESVKRIDSTLTDFREDLHSIGQELKRIPSTDLLRQIDQQLSQVELDKANVARHDIEIRALVKTQEADHKRIGDIEKDKLLFQQTLDMLADESRQQIAGLKELSTDVGIIKRGMLWDGNERRKK